MRKLHNFLTGLSAFALAGLLPKKAYAIDVSNWIDTGDFWGEMDPAEITELIVKWLMIFVFFMAVVYLIWAGYTYISAGGDAEKATLGRQGVINAIIGIVIILLAYAIVSWLMGTAAPEPIS